MYGDSFTLNPFRGIARKSGLAAAGLLFLVCGLASNASATVTDAQDDPSAFLRAFSDRAIEVLADSSMSKAERKDALTRFFRDGFDLQSISRFVLGRHWRSASPEELAEFEALFEAFVVSFYSDKLDAYNGETLQVGAARPLDGGTTNVSSTIVRPAAAPVRVDWRVRRDEAQWRIVDVVVEGVSLALVQRSEFDSVIRSQGGLEGLISILKQKVR
jgi:phospholipid transport system substrate-binding protein